MSKKTKPAARARGGAPDLDLQGVRIAPAYNRSAVDTQAIRAELRGSSEAFALGFAVRAYAPILELCRALVAAGIDPASPLEAWRGDVLALRVCTVGEGAELIIDEDRRGAPRIRRKPSVHRVAASPVPLRGPQRITPETIEAAA